MSLDFGLVSSLLIVFILMYSVFKGLVIVPQQEAWIVQNLGKFSKKLEPGLNFIVPFVENVAYKHSLKETSIALNEQITTCDFKPLNMEAIAYIRIIDPVAATYDVANPTDAMTQLTRSIMHAEIGKLTMKDALESRDSLITAITVAINDAAQRWGIQCLRFELKTIN